MPTELQYPVLLLPGWLDSGPGHWQTRWQARYADQRVEQQDWQWPRRGDWMSRLEEVLLEQTGPVLLAAHSLACWLVAAWAAHTAEPGRVAGALLVAPPDLGRVDLPPQLQGWRGTPRQRLPFPSRLICSSDDPYADLGASRALADDWSAALTEAGPVGHINQDSGLGDWEQGRALLAELETPRRIDPSA